MIEKSLQSPLARDALLANTTWRFVSVRPVQSDRTRLPRSSALQYEAERNRRLWKTSSITSSPNGKQKLWPTFDEQPYEELADPPCDLLTAKDWAHLESCDQQVVLETRVGQRPSTLDKDLAPS